MWILIRFSSPADFFLSTLPQHNYAKILAEEYLNFIPTQAFPLNIPRQTEIIPSTRKSTQKIDLLYKHFNFVEYSKCESLFLPELFIVGQIHHPTDWEWWFLLFGKIVLKSQLIVFHYWFCPVKQSSQEKKPLAFSQKITEAQKSGEGRDEGRKWGKIPRVCVLKIL